MPNPLSTGHLHLSFPSHPPPPTHSSLSLFRPSHFCLGVIGIGACSQTDSLSATLDQFNALLLEVFPTGSLFPLAKNCFVFEDSDGITNLNLGDNVPGLVVIPSMMGNKKLYIGTLLSDLCSHILGEFGRVVCMYYFWRILDPAHRMSGAYVGKPPRKRIFELDIVPYVAGIN
jgi:trafficking protein particle complex subunit 9